MAKHAKALTRAGSLKGWKVFAATTNRFCVNVVVKAQGIDLRLTAGACPQGGGGGRSPNSQEQRVFNVWHECGVGSTAAIAPGS